jgi:hypothetical protein
MLNYLKYLRAFYARRLTLGITGRSQELQEFRSYIMRNGDLSDSC